MDAFRSYVTKIERQKRNAMNVDSAIDYTAAAKVGYLSFNRKFMAVIFFRGRNAITTVRFINKNKSHRSDVIAEIKYIVYSITSFIKNAGELKLPRGFPFKTSGHRTRVKSIEIKLLQIRVHTAINYKMRRGKIRTNVPLTRRDRVLKDFNWTKGVPSAIQLVKNMRNVENWISFKYQ